MSFSRTVLFESLARRFRGPSRQRYSSWYLRDRVRGISLAITSKKERWAQGDSVALLDKDIVRVILVRGI